MREPIGRSARRPGRERKPREERRAELIDVATQVFYEKGYNAASLQDIADRMGMLKGSLYYYIRSKEELLFDVVSDAQQRGLAVVRARSDVEGDPLTRLRSVIQGHVVNLCMNVVSATVFLHEINALPSELRQEIVPGEDAYRRVFLDLIEEGQAAGIARKEINAEVALHSILGSANWVYRWFRPDAGMSAEEVGIEIADIAVRGIATDDWLKTSAVRSPTDS